MVERVDRAWVKTHGRQELVSHLNMGNEHHSTYRIVDGRDGRTFGLSFSSTYYKPVKRNGDLAGRTVRRWYVATHPEAIPTLDEALEILAIIRTAAEEPAHA
jgi:hypothetical protein